MTAFHRDSPPWIGFGTSRHLALSAFSTMSIRTPQQHRLDVIIGFAYTLGDAMSDEKWRVAQDFAATFVLGGLAFYAMRQSYPLTSLFATVGIGVLNTITVGQLYKAIREVQAENREQLVEDE